MNNKSTTSQSLYNFVQKHSKIVSNLDSNLLFRGLDSLYLVILSALTQKQQNISSVAPIDIISSQIITNPVINPQSLYSNTLCVLKAVDNIFDSDELLELMQKLLPQPFKNLKSFCQVPLDDQEPLKLSCKNSLINLISPPNNLENFDANKLQIVQEYLRTKVSVPLTVRMGADIAQQLKINYLMSFNPDLEYYNSLALIYLLLRVLSVSYYELPASGTSIQLQKYFFYIDNGEEFKEMNAKWTGKDLLNMIMPAFFKTSRCVYLGKAVSSTYALISAQQDQKESFYTAQYNTTQQPLFQDACLQATHSQFQRLKEQKHNSKQIQDIEILSDIDLLLQQSKNINAQIEFLKPKNDPFISNPAIQNKLSFEPFSPRTPKSPRKSATPVPKQINSQDNFGQLNKQQNIQQNNVKQQNDNLKPPRNSVQPDDRLQTKLDILSNYEPINSLDSFKMTEKEKKQKETEKEMLKIIKAQQKQIDELRKEMKEVKIELVKIKNKLQ
ncbi:Hypothetical_protein [Hexamita inflata]|uniref:Hypothetical_protein n=1 Tax=Hexamita inflata TaxID=28002 RepID=A0AA86Q397_9EUKA|nr:Hypothetical protein HINF_LOCUS36417 [Hexamita inflata]